MKRIAAIAAACALATTLVGCSSQEQPVENQQVQQEQQTEKSKAELAQEYLQSSEVQGYKEIADKFDDVTAALDANDYSACFAAYEEIKDRADALIDKDDVPEIAQKAHGYLCESAGLLRDASLNFALSLSATNADDVAKLQKQASDALSQSTDSSRLASSALQDMQREATAE